MGDTTETPPEQTPPTRPRIVPWLQVLGIIAIAGIAIADLRDHEDQVPWIVYGALLAMVFGVGPETITSIFKTSR